MSYPLRTVAAVTALGLAGAAVWALNSSGRPSGDGQETVTLGRIQNIALTTEHDCSELLSYYRKEGARMVGPYGLYSQTFMMGARTAGKVMADSSAATAVSGAQEGAAVAPDSTTNVQVEGVDESDVVKTEGDLMVAVVNGEVRVIRLAGAGTKTLATWRPAEGTAQSVLLEGGNAVVIGDRSGVLPMASMKRIAPGSAAEAVTDLTILDLTDPAKPRPVRRLEVGGSRSGEARLVDGELRLALTAAPTGIAWKQPKFPNWSPSRKQAQMEAETRKAERQATAANKKLVARSTIENWIPRATVTPLGADGKPSGDPVSRQLVDCENVAVPGSFSGLQTLALVSTDLKADEPLSAWRSAGVIAEGSTLYATADHAWLATSRWDAMPVDTPTSIAGSFAPVPASTQIHRFDTPLRADPAYVASGEIAGTLLNQFAMDEHEGQLRVASTTDGEASINSETTSDSASSSDGATSDGSTGSDSGEASDSTASDSAVSSDGTVSGGGNGVAGDGAAGDSAISGSSPGATGSAGASAQDVVTPQAGGATTAPAVDPAPLSDLPQGAQPQTGKPKLGDPQLIDPPTSAPQTEKPESSEPAVTPNESVRPTPQRSSAPTQSEARVTVLEVSGEQLVHVGVVTGLGVGERIRGVRFIGDIGYVVTYRQTDPLYTVDLSNPAQPRVRGELAVRGYSAYLHPAGDGKLLGLGQDGTDSGRTTGLQLSLFDVTNLDRPRRLDQVRLTEAWSDAEADHHAFTMAGDLVLVPYYRWSSLLGKSEVTSENRVDRAQFDAGVIAVRMSADGIGKAATLRPIADAPVDFDASGEVPDRIQRVTEATPLRTVVNAGTVYTLTPTGVAAHTSTDFKRLTFAKF